MMMTGMTVVRTIKNTGKESIPDTGNILGIAVAESVTLL
jgi:hypothetical protein